MACHPTKKGPFMPRYELMYILASAVSDDQVPQVADQILQFVTDFGGQNAKQELLGKKKLAYPIKKTRNGHYGVIDFVMDGRKLNDLDAKIRTQDATIIRYIIVNMDEHYERLAKDREIQSKLNRTRPAESLADEGVAPAAPVKKAAAKPAVPVTAAALDEEIEKALTEDITK